MVVHHLAWFRDDALIDEYVEVKRLLDNKSIFTKIRNKEIRASLEEKENRLVVQFNPVPDSMEYGRAVDEFIERLLPMIDATKKTLKQLSPDDLNKQYGNIIGNFVCDVYELANIDRDYNDTEYFWPFKHLYNLSQDPQFDHLFKRYKIIIANAYYNSMTDKKGNSP